MVIPNARIELRDFAARHPRVYRILFRIYCRLGTNPRPPQLFNFVGGERYQELGLGHFENLRGIAGAAVDDRVLDVGCGIGRVAVHFMDYLNSDGRYDGFDIVGLGVDWCNRRIARRRRNFRFRHVDLYNAEYNPTGRLDATTFKFPYADACFSLVFATSVLTHLLPDAALNYLREMSRVLEPGGRSLVTFFVINEESRRCMPSSAFHFQHTKREFWTMVPDNPEAAIAFDEDHIRDMYRQANLELQPPIRYGSWSGRNGAVGGQDIVLAIKR